MQMKELAGTSFKWAKDFFPNSFDSLENAKFNLHDVEYHINNLGYREKDFDDSYFQYDELFLGFGHNVVAGVAIPEKDNFLKLIERELENTRVLNFGIPKASTDTIARMVACTVPYFKPLCKKLSIIIIWPPDDRREVFMNGHHESVTAKSEPPFNGYFEGIDTVSNRYNRYKNEYLVDVIAQVYNIDIFTLPFNMYTSAVDDIDDMARDGVSPSVNWHSKFSIELLSQIMGRKQSRVSNEYFHTHIPPAWIAASPMKTVAGSSFKWGSDLFPQSPDNPRNAKFDSDDIVYKINTLGFREKEIEDSYFQYDELILGFGNSSAAGTGLADDDIFLRVLERSLQNVRILNLSIAKGAPDTIARMVACTVPYFKPLCKKLSIIIMWPQDVRREVFMDGHHEAVTACSEPPYPGYFLGIDELSSKYNRDKNKHIVELVCRLHDVNFYTVPYHMYMTSVDENIVGNDTARDGASPSANWHLKFAQAIMDQINKDNNGYI
jgi:hypothetical protein